MAHVGAVVKFSAASLLGKSVWELVRSDDSGDDAFLALARMGRTMYLGSHEGTLVEDTTPVWWKVFRCSGGITMELDGLYVSAASDRLRQEPSVLSMMVHCPPVVDIDADFEDVQQRLFDAAHDVGYFLVRDKATMLAAAQCMQAMADAVSSTTLAAQRTVKRTLRTSTGKEKVSFIPPIFEDVVLPQWLVSAAPSINAFYDAARNLGHRCLRLLWEGLGRPSTPTFDMLRCVSYPPHDGLDPHTDKSWLTVLFTSAWRGLEYASIDDGDSFTAAVPADTPPAVLVNIGDALQMWSEGLFVSRPHRVTPPGVSRVSLALFIEPDGDWPAPFVTRDVQCVEIAEA